ncbi:unnamed protein product [Brassica rapa subsp. trilocularis]
MRACIIYIEGLKKFAPLTSSRLVPNNHTWVQTRIYSSKIRS